MKLRRYFTSPLSLRIRQLGLFSAYRLISQLAGLAAGIVIVRALTPREYAFYAIALSIIGAVSVITESGVSSSLLVRLGRTRVPSQAADNLFTGALKAKTTVGLLIIIPVFALLIVLEVNNGMTLSEAAILAVAVLLTLLPTMTASVFTVVLQSQGQYNVLRNADLASSLARLVLVGLIAIASLPSAIIVTVVGAVGAYVQRALEWRSLRGKVRSRRHVPHAISKQFGRAMSASLPATIATIAGEQAILLMLTLHSNGSGIAAFTALSKYSAGLQVINAVVFTFGAARVAKVGAADATSRRTILLVYATVSALFVILTTAASPFLCGLLGQPYSQYRLEFVIVNAGTAITSFALYGVGSITHGLGWLKGSWTYIPVLVIALATTTALVDLNTIFGACLLSVVPSVAALISQVVRYVTGIRSHHDVG